MIKSYLRLGAAVFERCRPNRVVHAIQIGTCLLVGRQGAAKTSSKNLSSY
jgi:hypothetical protein